MTSPQQPQPQPQPEPHDTAAPGAAAPMPPAGAPEPPAQPPAEQPEPRPLAAHPQPEQPQAPMPPQAGPAPQEGGPAREAGTMMLQAQQPPAAAPGKEAGTMMLQAQAAPQGAPLPPQGAPKDAGTMTLQAQQPPAAPPQQPPYQPQQAAHQQAPQPPQQQIPAAWQAAGPGGGAPAYVSPIPVRRTNLGHALASEWTKIRSVRSTMWTLGVMIVLNVGIGLMIALLLSDPYRTADPLLGSAWLGLLLGTLCVIPLGVLVISSEYGTGMIRTTFTACPSRGRVLTAKAIVLFGLTFVITTLSTTLVAVVHAGMLNGPAPTGDQWLRATIGSGLYVAVLSLLALGAGALLRHSAGAISAMLGLVLLPMLLAVFMMTSESLRPVAKAMIEYSIPNSLGALYDQPFLGSGPSGWQPLLILVGVTAVVLGGAYAALEKRDV
ncbi:MULTISPECIES: ABC transporter permease subunit [Streptomyces]|uniref:ABC transporter permease subunit n=4 Tax=Streptomyces TaxID=1883 RepID=A0A8A1UUT4_STRR1|nr:MULTISPECIES: ABC transporter permease subunit [Streptomyces]QST83539.1 ABC transporter permease subunit [Streptomyces rimosus subsp. rimosus ATCC 10970]KEF06390.1 ABC transporter permease [Streptomyces rimosus]KEF21443.1 ABC transporter permease [Streptomyces rimosus]KOT36335.1 ABC transporter permease [Streptomyces sp. NRRL WC-3701]KOT37156.1 ABC transporter permease [Streptomyces rimosus subsp. rimosus]